MNEPTFQGPPIPPPSGDVCPHCGTEIIGSPEFCGRCGTRLRKLSSQPGCWSQILSMFLAFFALASGGFGACSLLFSVILRGSKNSGSGISDSLGFGLIGIFATALSIGIIVFLVKRSRKNS